MLKKGMRLWILCALAAFVMTGCSAANSGTVSILEDETPPDSVISVTEAPAAAAATGVSAAVSAETAEAVSAPAEAASAVSSAAEAAPAVSSAAKTADQAASSEETVSSAPEETPTPTPTKAAKKKKKKKKKTTTQSEETKDPDEGLTVIGTKDTGESTWRIPVKNETFSGIVFMSVKNADDESYPGNFFEEGKRLNDTESGVLYYTFGDPDALYNVKLQFDDGSIHFMTGVPFADMESARILYEDDTLFVVYQSKSEAREISTKETEQEWQRLARGESVSYSDEDERSEEEG